MRDIVQKYIENLYPEYAQKSLNTPIHKNAAYPVVDQFFFGYFNKGEISTWTREDRFAKEVITNGVTVNSVSPGSVSPSNIDDIDHTQPSDLAHIGRTGSDRENANLICFLASDEASYITGQNIQIDGCRRKL